MRVFCICLLAIFAMGDARPKMDGLGRMKDLAQDLDGEVQKIDGMAKDMSDALGKDVNPDAVLEFLDTNIEKAEEAFMEATKDMTSQEREDLKGDILEGIENLVDKPDLFRAVLHKMDDADLLGDLPSADLDDIKEEYMKLRGGEYGPGRGGPEDADGFEMPEMPEDGPGRGGPRGGPADDMDDEFAKREMGENEMSQGGPSRGGPRGGPEDADGFEMPEMPEDGPGRGGPRGGPEDADGFEMPEMPEDGPGRGGPRGGPEDADGFEMPEMPQDGPGRGGPRGGRGGDEMTDDDIDDLVAGLEDLEKRNMRQSGGRGQGQQGGRGQSQQGGRGQGQQSGGQRQRPEREMQEGGRGQQGGSGQSQQGGRGQGQQGGRGQSQQGGRGQGQQGGRGQGQQSGGQRQRPEREMQEGGRGQQGGSGQSQQGGRGQGQQGGSGQSQQGGRGQGQQGGRGQGQQSGGQRQRPEREMQEGGRGQQGGSGQSQQGGRGQGQQGGSGQSQQGGRGQGQQGGRGQGQQSGGQRQRPEREMQEGGRGQQGGSGQGQQGGRGQSQQSEGDEQNMRGSGRRRGGLRNVNLLELGEKECKRIADVVSRYTGEDVSRDDVREFINENGDEVERVLVKAVTELDMDEFVEFEELMDEADLMPKMLDGLSHLM